MGANDMTKTSDKKIFERLNAKSVVPMLLSDDTNIIVSRMAGGARQRQGFPEDLHLLIERPGKKPEERRYILASEMVER